MKLKVTFRRNREQKDYVVNLEGYICLMRLLTEPDYINIIGKALKEKYGEDLMENNILVGIRDIDKWK